MPKKRKLKFKKIKLHPATMYLLFILITIILSGILSSFKFQTSYNTINPTDLSITQNTIEVYNLFNFNGLKYMISNASRNFISFAPLSMFLLMAIGLSVSSASGFLDSVYKKVFGKINNITITFIIIFLATISTIINDIGYMLLIPLAAGLYESKGRNPISGIVATFCGVAFGTGTTIFVGSTEVALIPFTTAASRLVDAAYHISLLSNIFMMVASSIILSIIGTFIVEKIIVPKIGRSKDKKDIENLEEIEVIDEPNLEETEQLRLNKEYKESRGLKYSVVVFILILIFFGYALIPNLPLSGMLLDMNEETYLKQLFGENSYFQDGFTYMIALLFFLTGLAYGIGSKKFQNDRDVYNGCFENLKSIGGMIILIFLASQFIALFKKTNIGTVITGIFANVIDSVEFNGLPLMLIAFLLIAVASLFLTSAGAKWNILAPVLVPTLMQANISPQFMQFVLRAGDSIVKGITPLTACFVIYLGYLNMYNKDKENPITIREAIKMTMPYFIIISAVWLLIILGWYIIGLPIGPGVYPTI